MGGNRVSGGSARATTVAARVKPKEIGAVNLISARDFGANGTITDRVAIDAARALATTRGYGGVYLSAGDYLIGRQTTDLRCGLDFNGVDGFVLRGDGPGATRVRMEADFATAMRGVLRFRNCSRIYVMDMSIIGGWTDQPGDEQIHMVEVSGASGPVSDIHLINVEVVGARGDGVRFQGSASGPVRNCSVSYSRITGNKRAAVTGQLNTADIYIDHVYMENVTDSAVDLEPSSPGPSPKRWHFASCDAKRVGGNASRLWSMTGLSDYLEGSSMTDCTITDGNLNLLNCRGLKIANLTITGRNDASGTTQVVDMSKCVDVDIAHSTIIRPASAHSNQVIGLNTNDGVGNRGVRLTDVTIHQYTANHGIGVYGASDVQIDRGHVYYHHVTTATHAGVIVTSTVANLDVNNVVVRGLLVHGAEGGGTLARGVKVNSTSGPVGKVIVADNGGEGMVIGAELAGGASVPGFTAQPEIHGNHWTCSSSGYSGDFGTCPGLTCVVVGGNSGKRREFEGPLAPEGAVTGSVGDRYYRTGSTAGALEYLKETGTASTTGWVAKA